MTKMSANLPGMNYSRRINSNSSALLNASFKATQKSRKTKNTIQACWHPFIGHGCLIIRNAGQSCLFSTAGRPSHASAKSPLSPRQSRKLTVSSAP